MDYKILQLESRSFAEHVASLCCDVSNLKDLPNIV